MSDAREPVIAAIVAAFRGVRLGRGISLRQAQAIDQRVPFAAVSESEITDDWSRIPLNELERECVALLDAEGFRYYIPALMLSVLNHCDPASMRVIGTLAALYPKPDDRHYHMRLYALLSPAQCRAIARFLVSLPALVDLSGEDRKIVPRALRNYWRALLSDS